MVFELVWKLELHCQVPLKLSETVGFKIYPILQVYLGDRLRWHLALL